MGEELGVIRRTLDNVAGSDSGDWAHEFADASPAALSVSAGKIVV